MQKILADLKAGKNDALKAAGLSFGEAKTLSRTGQDPVSQAAFGLSLPAKTNLSLAPRPICRVTWWFWRWMK